MKVQNANTAAPAGKPRFTGWCLDKEDLCVAKLCAFREKDRNFVTALLDTGLVDGEVGQHVGVFEGRVAHTVDGHRPNSKVPTDCIVLWRSAVRPAPTHKQKGAALLE